MRLLLIISFLKSMVVLSANLVDNFFSIGEFENAKEPIATASASPPSKITRRCGQAIAAALDAAATPSHAARWLVKINGTGASTAAISHNHELRRCPVKNSHMRIGTPMAIASPSILALRKGPRTQPK